MYRVLDGMVYHFVKNFAFFRQFAAEATDLSNIL
jgi:hypothetical protein